MASKPVKIVTGIVGAIFVIVASAIIGVFVFAGDIIKTTVEELGPQLTKAEVKLAEVDLSLTSGEATLSGLKNRQPGGISNAVRVPARQYQRQDRHRHHRLRYHRHQGNLDQRAERDRRVQEIQFQPLER